MAITGNVALSDSLNTGKNIHAGQPRTSVSELKHAARIERPNLTGSQGKPTSNGLSEKWNHLETWNLEFTHRPFLGTRKSSYRGFQQKVLKGEISVVSDLDSGKCLFSGWGGSASLRCTSCFYTALAWNRLFSFSPQVATSHDDVSSPFQGVK